MSLVPAPGAERRPRRGQPPPTPARRRWSRRIGVREPQRPARGGGDELIERDRSGMPRRPQITRAGTIPPAERPRHRSPRWRGAPAGRLRFREGMIEIGDGRSSTATPRPRQGLRSRTRTSGPRCRARHEADAMVDRDELAVVAPDPERAVRRGRLKARTSTSAAKARQKGCSARPRSRASRTGRGPARRPSLLDERFREGPPGLVVRDDEVLEADRLGPSGSPEPGRVPSCTQELQSAAVPVLPLAIRRTPGRAGYRPPALPLARKPGKLSREVFMPGQRAASLIRVTCGNAFQVPPWRVPSK